MLFCVPTDVCLNNLLVNILISAFSSAPVNMNNMYQQYDIVAVVASSTCWLIIPIIATKVYTVVADINSKQFKQTPQTTVRLKHG